MKKRLVGMLTGAGVGLALLISLNLLSAPVDPSVGRFSKESLFSAEPMLRAVSAVLSSMGISVAPERVVVGRSGWLYLGDEGWGSLSAHRSPANRQDEQLGRAYGEAVQRWNTWLLAHGVQSFRVLVAPDKESVYPDHLPGWARLDGDSHADALMRGAASPLFIDTRPTLRAAAGQATTDLYFRTDTHWNAAGAVHAFRMWVNELDRSAAEVRWPSAQDLSVTGQSSRDDGDLARLLHLPASEEVPLVGISGLAQTLEHKKYGEDTLVDARLASNASAQLRDPLMIRNPEALNQRKVLWLTDSFGRAMDDMMLHTFSDVVRLHWRDVHDEGGWFVRIVQEWQPDLVLVTVAERSLNTPTFSSALQFSPAFVPNERERIGESVRFDLVGTSGLVQSADGSSQFSVTGNPVTLHFQTSRPMPRGSTLSLNLRCDDGLMALPMNMFWRERAAAPFHRDRSMKTMLVEGHGAWENLGSVEEKGRPDVREIRLVLRNNGKCSSFDLDGLSYRLNL